MNNLYEMGLSTVQIRTGICLEDLKLSSKEKKLANKKIQKIIANSTLEEINSYIDRWCIKKEGNDVIKYIIYMLDDLVFLSQNESLVLEMARFNDKLETSFNESLKLAKKSSYLD